MWQWCGNKGDTQKCVFPTHDHGQFLLLPPAGRRPQKCPLPIADKVKCYLLRHRRRWHGGTRDRARSACLVCSHVLSTCSSCSAVSPHSQEDEHIAKIWNHLFVSSLIYSRHAECPPDARCWGLCSGHPKLNQTRASLHRDGGLREDTPVNHSTSWCVGGRKGAERKV